MIRKCFHWFIHRPLYKLTDRQPRAQKYHRTKEFTGQRLQTEVGSPQGRLKVWARLREARIFLGSYWPFGDAHVVPGDAAVRRPTVRNNALCPRPDGMHTEIRVARAIIIGQEGNREVQQGSAWRTDQGRGTDNHTGSVEMEMWPLCYVHHTAPPAVFRVHSFPWARGDEPLCRTTLPLTKPLRSSHFLTLPASYVVGNYGVRIGVRDPKRYPSGALPGFEVIVSHVAS